MTDQSFKNWLLVYALWLGVLWGIAEGGVFFIVPDVLISLIALFSFKRSLQCMAAVLFGSLIAGALLYAFATSQPLQAQALIQAVPFVTDAMISTVYANYSQYGITAILNGPLSGIPYKIYAVLAPHFTPFIPFLLVSIPARLERFVISWSLFGAIGYMLRNKRETYIKRIFAFHALYWVAAYVYYLSVVVYG